LEVRRDNSSGLMAKEGSHNATDVQAAEDNHRSTDVESEEEDEWHEGTVYPLNSKDCRGTVEEAG